MTLLPHPVVGGAFPSPVPPGAGWPDDPATPTTPVARDAAEVAAFADAGLDEHVAVVRVEPEVLEMPEALVQARGDQERPVLR